MVDEGISTNPPPNLFLAMTSCLERLQIWGWGDSSTCLASMNISIQPPETTLKGIFFQPQPWVARMILGAGQPASVAYFPYSMQHESSSQASC